ncbi:hypothetical protein P280DRAFT_512927 [Massarina eburnea CBS 473.64]|uniref:Uncharacterized protein n=1 Tax=Massarina eburnea CBS 473.64 TaxID=1395130 RepID=A0A6A6SIJ6_9PLEO|nr:hypothetical protein P280DRAFT_512927 [Massarina eburnea CBS 473.64]
MAQMSDREIFGISFAVIATVVALLTIFWCCSRSSGRVLDQAELEMMLLDQRRTEGNGK